MGVGDNTRMNPGIDGDLIATNVITDGGVAHGAEVERVKAGFGADGEYTDPSIATPFPTMPSAMFYAELALGNVPGWGKIRKFGQNTDIDSGQIQDIWDGGGIYQWMTSAAQLELVSTSANDTPGNIGAHTVQVYGLDANYAEINEFMTLDGTDPVFTVKSYIRVFRIEVLNAGLDEISGVNTGNLKLQDIGGAGFVRAQVSIGNNQTQMAIWTVPAGKTFFMTAIFASIYNAQSKGYGEMELRIRPFGFAFREQLNAGMATDGTTSFSHSFTTLDAIPEKTDMLIRATATVNNTKAIGSFGGLIRDN